MAGVIQEDAIITKELKVGSNSDSKKLEINATNGTSEVVSIKNDGTGNSLFIDHNGAVGVGINVASDSDDNIISFANSFNGTNTVITNLGYGKGSLGSNWFFRNLASDITAGPVVLIEQDNAGDDQVALKIQQDGDNSGILITTTTAKAAPLELTPQAAPPATAREGMIYMDTDHHLYVHNGTTWVQLDN